MPAAGSLVAGLIVETDTDSNGVAPNIWLNEASLLKPGVKHAIHIPQDGTGEPDPPPLTVGHPYALRPTG